MVQHDVGDGGGVAGDEVDDPRGQAGRLEQPQDAEGARDRRGGRLPHDRVAHEGGGGGEVAGDRREVEGRHRVDEALERPVVELVPHRAAGERLLGVQLLRVVRVEAPEVDELRRRVDLGLEGRLRLAEHGRRVERGAPRGGQELRGLEEDGGAVLPGPARPLAPGRGRGLDRLRDVLLRGLVPVGEDVAVVVRHHRLRGLAAADVLSADDQRDLDTLRGHLLQPGLELGPLGRPGGVALDRLVDGRGHPPCSVEAEVAGHGCFLSLSCGRRRLGTRRGSPSASAANRRGRGRPSGRGS